MSEGSWGGRYCVGFDLEGRSASSLATGHSVRALSNKLLLPLEIERL